MEKLQVTDDFLNNFQSFKRILFFGRKKLIFWRIFFYQNVKSIHLNFWNIVVLYSNVITGFFLLNLSQYYACYFSSNMVTCEVSPSLMQDIFRPSHLKYKNLIAFNFIFFYIL